MVTSETVLDALREEEGRPVSGAALATKLGVSRAAIWKHVSKLRRAGYGIETVAFEGYKFVSRPDMLLSGEIKAALKTTRFGRDVYSFQKTSCTSDVASALARGGAAEGTVIVADKQTEGRGRMGRSWESPAGVGIWFSIILRPGIPPMNAPQVTITSAVAISEVLQEETGLEALIEWPNDVVIRGKKVCGILTEIVAEQDRADFVILGIGLNVNQTGRDFSPSLRAIATSLYLEDGVRRDRTALFQKLLERLEGFYDTLLAGKFGEIAALWVANSYTLGRRVRCTCDGHSVEGTAENLALDGALAVRTDGGELRRVTSGDISYV